MGNYLGLPADLGSSKVQALSYIKERLEQRIQAWQARFLSLAGKETLIKSVALAIPSYVMQTLKLPTTLILNFHSTLANFWWHNCPMYLKNHWLPWEALSEKKKDGGLGFHDIHCLNLAFLGKQAWRVATNQTSLVSRLLKAKYFPHCDFLNANLGRRPSWIWISILEGRMILKAGPRWRIGDGKSVHINRDPWVPHPPSYRPISTTDPTSHAMVSFLINSTSKESDFQKINSLFDPDDVQRIIEIPLPIFDYPDALIWHFPNNGSYSVKTGYEVALHLKRNGQLGKRPRGECRKGVLGPLYGMSLPLKIDKGEHLPGLLGASEDNLALGN
ncbi:hypothetical protein Dimus_039082 [Dionaea muscipula]